MALTEEECKAAVNDIEYDLCDLEERKTGVDVCCLYNENLEIFRELVREYFQLKEKYNKLLDDVHDYRYETQSMKITIRNLCKHFGVESEKELQNIYLNKPYKFEELKKGMWVWDNVEKCCFPCSPAISTDMAQCVTYTHFWYNCGEDEDEFFEEYDEFEEGRFFPVTKALEYQE